MLQKASKPAQFRSLTCGITDSFLRSWWHHGLPLSCLCLWVQEFKTEGVAKGGRELPRVEDG